MRIRVPCLQMSVRKKKKNSTHSEVKFHKIRQVYVRQPTEQANAWETEAVRHKEENEQALSTQEGKLVLNLYYGKYLAIVFLYFKLIFTEIAVMRIPVFSM